MWQACRQGGPLEVGRLGGAINGLVVELVVFPVARLPGEDVPVGSTSVAPGRQALVWAVG